MKRILASVRLIILGFQLERVRKKLERLYMANEPNDSRRMKRTRRRFNRMCDRWAKIEMQYRKYGVRQIPI